MNKTTGLLIGAILLVIVLVYWFFIRGKEAITPGTTTTSTPPTPPTPPPPSLPTNSEPTIEYTVQNIMTRTINYTISAGGGIVTGTASPSSNTGILPLGNSEYQYSINGSSGSLTLIRKITMKIYKYVSTPFLHQVVVKEVTVQV